MKVNPTQPQPHLSSDPGTLNTGMNQNANYPQTLNFPIRPLQKEGVRFIDFMNLESHQTQPRPQTPLDVNPLTRMTTTPTYQPIHPFSIITPPSNLPSASYRWGTDFTMREQRPVEFSSQPRYSLLYDTLQGRKIVSVTSMSNCHPLFEP